MRGRRRGYLLAMALVLVGLLAAPVQPARAQDYPNRPVHILVGFAPGSVADLSARVLTNRLGQVLGQQFVVENKTGAGSAVAAEAGARAPKDGYTLFLGSSATLTNQLITPNPAFDMAKDFAPIALVTEVKVVLVVHPSTGVKSVKELIALAKAKAGSLIYASVGPGSAPHLAAELFDARAGVKMIHVPYQGSPQALTDLIAGRTAVMFSPAPTAVPQVEAGKIVALATAAATRASIAPDVPTMAEAGMPNFETGIWFGLMAPAGTPHDVVEKLARAVPEAMDAGEAAAALRTQGLERLAGGPDAFARYIVTETAKWNEAARAAGLKK
jgi:tripartite-type tricarboxylate transporter receptor subunit TctC